MNDICVLCKLPLSEDDDIFIYEKVPFPIGKFWNGELVLYHVGTKVHVCCADSAPCDHCKPFTIRG